MTSNEYLTGHQIIEHAPLGALISYSDGTPRPPDRFKNKLSAWKRNNGSGRLVEKNDTSSEQSRFILHGGDYGANGVVVLTIRHSFMTSTDLRFEITLPPPGSVRVLAPRTGGHELLHLAENREAAEQWLAENPYSDAFLDPVPDHHAAPRAAA